MGGRGEGERAGERGRARSTEKKRRSGSTFFKVFSKFVISSCCSFKHFFSISLFSLLLAPSSPPVPRSFRSCCPRQRIEAVERESMVLVL